MNVQYAPLGQLITLIRNGLNTAQYDEPEDDLLPITRIETISEGVIDTARIKYARVSAAERKKYQLQSGDILFSHINSPAHIGKTAIYRSGQPLIHGVNLLLLRPNQKRCHPEYLNYYLKSVEVRALFRARCKKAVNQASLNQGDVKALDVPLPPLPEQKRIAAILTKADRLRRLRRYALDLSDTYLQSVFLEMFGSCLVGDRYPKFSDVLECPLQNGVFEKNDKYGSGTPVIWVDNLYHTISIAVEGLRRAELETEAVDKYEVIEDDLLFTRSSLVREGIGQVNCNEPQKLDHVLR